MSRVDLKKLMLLLSCWIFLTVGSSSAQSQDADFKQGMQAFSQKNYRQAISSLEKYLKGRPPDATTTYYLAIAHAQTSNVPRAKQLFEYIVSAFPQSKEATLAQTALGKWGAAPTPANAATSPSSPATSVPDPGRTEMEDKSDSAAACKAEFAALPDEVQIPFTTGDRGHMVVEAQVDGRFIKCHFDTGATAYFGANQLREAGIRVPTGDPVSHATGWAGKQVPVWNTTANVKIGGVTRRIPIWVAEHWDALPLIGQDFLKDYQYSIDRGANRMMLHKKTAKSSNATASSTHTDALYDVPMKFVDDRDCVDVEILGKKVSMIIDTGSASTIISENTANSLGIDTTGAPRTVRTGVGGNVIFRQIVADVRLGPVVKKDFPINVGGMGTNAIGQDFMSGWRFTVDRERHLMRFFH